MVEVQAMLNSKELQRKSKGKEKSDVKASQLKEDLKRGITRIQEENPNQNPKLEENVSFATRKDIIKRNVMKGKEAGRKKW